MLRQYEVAHGCMTQEEADEEERRIAIEDAARAEWMNEEWPEEEEEKEDAEKPEQAEAMEVEEKKVEGAMEGLDLEGAEGTTKGDEMEID